MAWNKQEKDIRPVDTGEGIENERFFAFPCAGGEPDRALTQRLSPLCAEL